MTDTDIAGLVTRPDADSELLRKWADVLTIPSGEFVNEDLRRIADRIERLQAERDGQWQDIATAPKDGTRVLLAAPGHLTMIGSFEAWKTIHAAGPWWWSNGAMITPDPTHWRPLPAPPAKENGNG